MHLSGAAEYGAEIASGHNGDLDGPHGCQALDRSQRRLRVVVADRVHVAITRQHDQIEERAVSLLDSN